MSQVKVNFTYDSDTITIQCKNDEKMSEIIEKYGKLAKININEVFFLYNGVQIDNKELRYEEIISISI